MSPPLKPDVWEQFYARIERVRPMADGLVPIVLILIPSSAVISDDPLGQVRIVGPGWMAQPEIEGLLTAVLLRLQRGTGDTELV
jgi:hypothetical protein